MKKDNYVKAVYSVFFVGLVIMTITVFILLKYMDVTNFFDNLDSFYSFFYDRFSDCLLPYKVIGMAIKK